MAKTKSKKSFEQMMAELEEVVASLEESPSLEEAVESFEKGMELFKKCQAVLDESERKVKFLREGSTGALNDE